MVKIILNNDLTHVIEAENFNYSATFKIDNYSERGDSINFNILVGSIPNLSAFENTPIESIKITNVNDEEIVSLSFTTNDLYIINYSTTIYDTSASSYVNLGRVVISNNDVVQ